MFPPTKRGCLKFHFHMLGDGIETFNIYFQGKSGTKYEIMNKVGHQGKEWHKFAMIFTFLHEPFEVNIHHNFIIFDIHIQTKRCLFL